MIQNKKYDYRILQNKQSWTAQIMRRVTANKSIASKSQKFPSEAEAIAWAETELNVFSQNQHQRNQRENETRKQAAELKKQKELAIAKQIKQKVAPNTDQETTPNSLDNYDDFFEESISSNQ